MTMTRLWYNYVGEKVSENLRLEVLEIARRIVDAASDKQATNIVLLDVRELAGFTDYFVICSGDSERQLRTIQEEVWECLKREAVKPHHQEGTVDSGWLLLDYGDIIVHIFSAAEREHYKLDELWREAPTVLRVQ